MRTLIVLLLVAFVGLLAFGIAAQAPDRSIDEGLQRGAVRPAPPFALSLLDSGDAPSALRSVVSRAAADGVVSLRELRGTPLVLNFWASWCDPCRAESAVLQRGWLYAAPRGVLFLGVDQQDATEDARGFLREFEITYPSVREAGKEVSRRYGATGFPETYFIDADGSVVAHVIGEVDDGQLRAGIAATREGAARQLGGGGPRRASP